MIAGIHDQELSWLRKFFSERNQVQWENIEGQTVTQSTLDLINPWLNKLKTGIYEGPLVLPMLDVNNQITWYAMASDDRRFAQMVDEIMAFVGASYSDFRREWAKLCLDNTPECALVERFGERVVKFSPLLPLDRQKIENALGLYLSVLSRRPDIPDRTQRPFGKIRSDFDCALLAGNSEGAQTLLDELIASGRVNAEQKKCLEIRFLNGLGRSEELARNRTLIASLVDISLPAQTIVDIVSALYETFVTPVEYEKDHGYVIEVFKEHILKPFGPLFRERKGIRQPIVLRAFLLSELASPEPNIERCRLILDAYPESAEGYGLASRWYGKLKEETPRLQIYSKGNQLSQAKQAIADEDYEEACSHCFDLLPDQWAYGGLLRCALEIYNADLTQRVLDVFANAPNEVNAKLSKKDHVRLKKLREEVGVKKIANESEWIAWAKQIASNPLKAPTVAELQEMAAKWSVDEYAQNPNICDSLASYIANASIEAERVFRDAFGVLVDFFSVDTPGTHRAFKPIIMNLIKVLGWSGCLSSDELEISSQLAQSLLASGLSHHEYSETLSDLQEILNANASPVHFDWGLNLSELLAQYPAPDGGSLRLNVFTDVVEMLRATPHRVTIPQRDILAGLAVDYYCPDLLECFPKVSQSVLDISSDEVAFEGLIGIYTLTEAAGLRAKEVLMARYPKSVVEVNNDPVSTDRLIALAKKADVFVFAWKSSKHQAYFCVKQARLGLDIILPIGKGSASILSAVINKIGEM